MQLTWTKPVVIQAVIHLDYAVLYSDLDTIWLKGAVRSLARGLDLHDADITAAAGKYFQTTSTGMLYLI